MRHSFYLEIDPPTATAQERKVSVRSGRVHFYNPDSVKYAKELLTLELNLHRPPRYLEGPLKLDVEWRFRARTHKPGWRVTKPDTDNLQKLLKDCMTRCCFWRDDAQVCYEVVKKMWCRVPGIYITVEEIGEENETRRNLSAQAGRSED